MEEIVRAFTHLIDTGKAFHWGTSEWTSAQIEEAHHIADKRNLIAPSVEQRASAYRLALGVHRG